MCTLATYTIQQTQEEKKHNRERKTYEVQVSATAQAKTRHILNEEAW